MSGGLSDTSQIESVARVLLSVTGNRGRISTETAKRMAETFICELAHEGIILGRQYRYYGCAKRGCDAVNPDYLSFGAGGKSYCLSHIPLRASLKMWWREQAA